MKVNLLWPVWSIVGKNPLVGRIRGLAHYLLLYKSCNRIFEKKAIIITLLPTPRGVGLLPTAAASCPSRRLLQPMQPPPSHTTYVPDPVDSQVLPVLFVTRLTSTNLSRHEMVHTHKTASFMPLYFIGNMTYIVIFHMHRNNLRW